MVCLFSIVPFANLSAQTGTTSLERKLRRDAARLTLRAMMEKGDNRLNEIEIPQEAWDEHYRILLDIYQQQPIAKALEKCNLHTCPDPSVDHLLLIVKKNTAWAAPLQDGGGQTADSEINALIKKHDIQISIVNWDDTHDAVTLNASRPLNIVALAKAITSLVEIVKIGEMSLKSRGNDIIVKRNSNGWEVTYLFRFGPQFGKNHKEHQWVFQYNLSGIATLKSESGDTLPGWMPCELIR